MIFFLSLPQELRELTKLTKDDENGASFHVRQDELELGLTEASQAELDDKSGRPKVRINKLLQDTAKSTEEAESQVHLRFLMNPIEFQADDHRDVSAVVCERTKLDGEPGSQRAVGTGETETIPANLVSRYISDVWVPFISILMNVSFLGSCEYRVQGSAHIGHRGVV